MRKIISFASFALILLFISCNEDNWLKEVPLDFYSPENAYTTPEQFNSAIANEYRRVSEYYVTNSKWALYVLKGTFTDEFRTMYSSAGSTSDWGARIVPENAIVSYYWDEFYKTIANMNVVLNRIDGEDVEFPIEAERTVLKAEAMFFRGFAYRGLANLYGGVPIVLDEISTPKRDFVRASHEETLAQAISDLTFAAENLPDVTALKEDGRLTKAVANHFLAEIYIIKKDWDKAIAAASLVINNSAYALMTKRFGAWKDKPGDVYRDLFIRDNQNRNCAGGGPNTEGIWVSQYEYNVPGGGSGLIGSRQYGIWYYSLQGKDGKPLFFGHSSQYGGRGIGFCATNKYVEYDIWNDCWTDMRNSEYNVWRDMVADNPKSAYFGKKIVESGAFPITAVGPYEEFWRPYFVKLIPVGNFPVETISNLETGATFNTAIESFTDTYVIRLPETYLLRAEAYLGKGNKASAAADINVIRARANATPVAPDDVDIDYILDERARELYMEETRLLTLMRLGSDVLVERVLKYNDACNGKFGTLTMHDYNALFPIPQSAIERNTEAVLEQNPGYSN